MMNDSWENELWDDDCLETGPIYHHGCGGRVYWIYQEEFRCLRCCGAVELDLLEIAGGATTNEK